MNTRFERSSLGLIGPLLEPIANEGEHPSVDLGPMFAAIGWDEPLPAGEQRPAESLAVALPDPARWLADEDLPTRLEAHWQTGCGSRRVERWGLRRRRSLVRLRRPPATPRPSLGAARTTF
ncbi:MAG: hypothetical protein R3B96_20055 [Pirellulaceae bacterium]